MFRKQRVFSGRRRLLPLAAALILPFVLQACARNTIESAIPQPEELGPPAPELDRSRIRNTGEFPNTNTVPEGETAQMTTEEKTEFLARMKEEQDQQNKRSVDPTAYQSEVQRMQDIARNHGENTLREIEEGQ